MVNINLYMIKRPGQNFFAVCVWKKNSADIFRYMIKRQYIYLGVKTLGNIKILNIQQ